MRYLACFILLLLIRPALHAQTIPTDTNLVQFSGLVLSDDSLKAIPYATIQVKSSHLGTHTDREGFFSFVAQKGDTIVFRCTGYRQTQFIIPVNLIGNRYSMVKTLTNDTISLPQVVIKPWPTKEQFNYEFINGTFPDDQLENAQKNLEQQMLQEMSQKISMDGSSNYTNYMNQQYARYYYTGQSPPVNILNPLAWNEFFKAWREGKFKKKKTTY